jgi:hypothetical protein
MPIQIVNEGNVPVGSPRKRAVEPQKRAQTGANALFEPFQCGCDRSCGLPE